MANFRISEQFRSILTSLNNQSVISNSVKNPILSDCNVLKDGYLSLDEIKELRSFISKSLVDSDNIAVGLWHNNIKEVFELLKSLDKAIFDDGDENIKLLNLWEE